MGQVWTHLNPLTSSIINVVGQKRASKSRVSTSLLPYNASFPRAETHVWVLLHMWLVAERISSPLAGESVEFSKPDFGLMLDH